MLIDGYATKKKLKKLFTDILPNKIKPTNRDRLIVYFAGHGIARESDEGLEGYLIPQDAKSKDPDSLLKMSDVHNWLAQLKCKHYNPIKHGLVLSPKDWQYSSAAWYKRA